MAQYSKDAYEIIRGYLPGFINILKTMIGNTLWWFELAIGMMKEDGVWAVLKRWPRWTSRRFYYTAHLCERKLSEEVLLLNKSDFKLDGEDISLKIVCSNKEADQLENEGFAFRSWRTHDNRRLKTYRERLDHGAIAFCVFAGNELAQISWIGPNQRAKDYLTKHQFAVDFSKGQVFATGSWTNPEFRGKGLYKNNLLFNRDPFLIRNGKNATRSILGSWHPVGYEVHPDHIGSIPYAELRFIRILWWKWWKEMPLR